MPYTEVTYKSWGERLKDSSGRALFGIILFFSAFYLLFWNEGRAIHRAQSLEEGGRIVVEIDSDIIEWVYDGMLVHLSGEARAEETLIDAMFGVEATNVIKLRRIVEMYQWNEVAESETEELLGGSARTETTYTYSKTWSTSLIDSSQFQQPDGHKNPSYMPVNGETMIAKSVKMGEFALSPTMIEKLNNYQHLPMTAEHFEQSQKKPNAQLYNKGLHLHYGSYYVGYDPANPEIGDLRIKFEVVRPATISVIAKQIRSRLTPYMTKAGGEIELFEYGAVMAGEMFKRAQLENTVLTWILRLFGFLMMFIGFNLILHVLRIMAAVIPILGKIIGIIGMFISLIITLMLSIITIAIAWLFYRPLLSLTLLVIAMGLLYFLKFSRQSQDSSIEQQSPKLVSEIEVPNKN